jgi:hypothetical protein
MRPLTDWMRQVGYHARGDQQSQMFTAVKFGGKVQICASSFKTRAPRRCVLMKVEENTSGQSMAPVDPVRFDDLGAVFPVLPKMVVIRRAFEHARCHSPLFLFDHVVRSWVFAATMAGNKPRLG